MQDSINLFEIMLNIVRELDYKYGRLEALKLCKKYGVHPYKCLDKFEDAYRTYLQLRFSR